jgi:hypothetical protein
MNTAAADAARTPRGLVPNYEIMNYELRITLFSNSMLNTRDEDEIDASNTR